MKGKWTLTGIIGAVVLLALAVGLTRAQGPEPPGEEVEPQDVGIEAVANTIPIQGRLTDASGTPLNGTYSITATLYTASSGGTALCTDTDNVPVSNGLFRMDMHFCTSDDINGRPLYLGIQVGSDAEMTPRQPIYPVPYAFSLRPGAIISGSNNVLLVYGGTDGYATLYAHDMSPNGGYGVYGNSDSSGGYGVYGYNNNGGTAIGAWSNGGGRDRATIRATNVYTATGMAAYLVNQSAYHTVHLRNNGTNGGVLYLQNYGDATGTGGWDFITAQNRDESDPQFRVLSSGEVRSDVGFATPASDFAEMLPAVEGLEPGDVLVVGIDGKLARSTEAYQPTVVGVYSTQPGFVGGHPVEEEAPEGHIPLAIAGVVPVKASAENGPIRPGDLLVASSTPGHAMKAGPNPAVGTVIGKALSALESGTGVIRMLVMLQ